MKRIGTTEMLIEIFKFIIAYNTIKAIVTKRIAEVTTRLQQKAYNIMQT